MGYELIDGDKNQIDIMWLKCLEKRRRKEEKSKRNEKNKTKLALNHSKEVQFIFSPILMN